jgi:hypothetical protein
MMDRMAMQAFRAHALRIGIREADVKHHSFPIQDEPEGQD